MLNTEFLKTQQKNFSLKMIFEKSVLTNAVNDVI